ncbi:MAG TPA: NUDIX hydrolase [Deltaproteobacteria bacterium]|nr:NUDIX hydrolase [Deltaproteobacteria bacterium]HPR55350.1 NUDIX hydrolase [Deltaproteobacteria bacterium]HXK48541.1 NUDIX hydrolase [Deltaproteobacteria bacterium]
MPVHKEIPCPSCGHPVTTYRNPVPTVDAVIEFQGGIVLVLRKNPPPGWALPGGFVDYGESVEEAVRREALEETGLSLAALKMFSVYSDPLRDPRQHTITTVFAARGAGNLHAGDDAARVEVFDLDHLPHLAFDHARILEDYRAWIRGKDRGLARK